MPFSYTSSQDFLSLSELNIDGIYAAYALHKMMKNELHKVQGTSIKGITKDELLSKTIMAPSKDEQQKIGQLFFTLDNLITLHQRESYMYLFIYSSTQTG